MALSRHIRLTLRVASLTCLLLALLPYYSRTAGPAVFPGVPSIDLPPIGTLPEGPSKTVFRLGLPFSPLLTYQNEISFESNPARASAPASTIDGNTKDESGDAASVSFSGTIGYTHDWRFGFFSWSVALGILGVGLLILSFWNYSSRSRNAPDVASGSNA